MFTIKARDDTSSKANEPDTPANQVKRPVVSCDSTNKVTITCETAGARIYYTTNGSEPTDKSTLYSSDKITATAGTPLTVKTIAAKEHLNKSAIESETFRLWKVTFSLDGGKAILDTSAPIAQNVREGGKATRSATAILQKEGKSNLTLRHSCG